MRALVTGAAGLIGSHIVDLLVAEGWKVRGFDALEPATHPRGRPPWIAPQSDFVVGDVRDVDAVNAALDGVDVVFHEAAYGGFFPELDKLCDVNVTGTARLLEAIRVRGSQVRKVVLASSQVVYREGTAVCAEHGRVQPRERDLVDLEGGDWRVRCPVCGRPSSSVMTSEDAPIAGDTPYAVSKAAQERLALTWSRQSGVPVVALRYACTYGPRQSVFNPYTGIIAIFSTQLLNGRAPTLYEDGEQTRDLCFVEDVARANIAAATTDVLDGYAVNVGTGVGVSVRTVAETVARALGVEIVPVVTGEFRPGDLRHLASDVALLACAGFVPRTDLATGVERYVAWIRTQGDIRDYFAAAQERLRGAGLIRRSRAKNVAHA